VSSHWSRRTKTGTGRWLLVAVVVLLAVGLVALLAPAGWAATGNDVGQNLGSLLKHYAAQIYGGVIAIVSLVFLINRRYTELAMFLLAAVVVAWLVFAADDVAKAARAIGRQILG
jgi:cell division protein FtsW (lipid II flippase)